jgi:hypothetical protein
MQVFESLGLPRDAHIYILTGRNRLPLPSHLRSVLNYNDCEEIATVVPAPLETYFHLACMLPSTMRDILLLLVEKSQFPSQRVHSVELFAGCHSITNGVKSYGLDTVPRLV